MLSPFVAINDMQNNNPVYQIATGGRHTVILLKDNRMFVTGANDSGQLGLGNTED